MTRAIDVRLFGAFRQFGASPTIRVPLDDGATVNDLRTALSSLLPGADAHALLAASAFATDERMLADAEAVPQGITLALLPPVCGG